MRVMDLKGVNKGVNEFELRVSVSKVQLYPSIGLHHLVSRLPKILPEHLIAPFNFYWNGGIHRGMSYEGNLYGLVQSFESFERGQAYTLGSNLSKQGGQAVITVSDQACYRVWLDLRSEGIWKWWRAG